MSIGRRRAIIGRGEGRSTPTTATVERYSWPAVAFHWVMALLILTAIALAWWFEAIPRTGFKRQLVQLHASCGVTVLALAFLRMAWRLYRRPPRFVADMPEWQRLSANGVHVALYGAMFLQPLSGYVTSVSGGHAPQWFGLVTLPALVGVNRRLHEVARALHLGTQWALYGLLAVHVAAALHHQFVARDAGLWRMLPLRMLKRAPPARTPLQRPGAAPRRGGAEG